MFRSEFLHSLVTGISALKTGAFSPEFTGEITRQPPFLQKGDQIGIPGPAGYMFMEELEPALRLLRSWGYEPVPGKHIGEQWGNMGGIDDVRVRDLQDMLDNPDIKAVFFARGGYGLIRILHRLDFHRFRRHPKWLIGFSDVSVLHAHLNRHFGMAAIHSKMCNSVPADLSVTDPEIRESLDMLRQLLAGKRPVYHAPFHPANVQGVAQGELIGGNLSVLYGLQGTGSAVSAKGKILFLEDAGEYLYHYDRMFWNLENARVFEHLKGLIIGGFRAKPSEDPKEEFPLPLERIVLEKVKRYGFPVAFQFPVGHQKHNLPLKCGTVHRLEVGGAGTRLQEILP